MHYSEIPTDYIFVRAETSSEFDACDYIIIHVSDSWKMQMVQRLSAVKSFAGDDNCKHIAYRASPTGFYTFGDTEQEVEFEKVTVWCFIRTTDIELEEMETINVEICAHELLIQPDGEAMYKAYADQNNDEFYSFDFKITDMLAAKEI